MNDAEDITYWIQKLGSDDEVAPDVIWEHVFDKLVRIVRRRLERSHLERCVRDEEDVVLSAVKSLLVGVSAGRFHLNDRNDLWRVLFRLIRCKIQRKREYDWAQKRRGENSPSQVGIRTYHESELGGTEDDRALEKIMGDSSPPEVSLMMLEAFQELTDDEQAIAVLKMNGDSHEAIADQLQCSVQTVTRRVASIKRRWTPNT